MLLPSMWIGAWVASQAARARRDRLIVAMQVASISRKVAAYHMGLSEAQLSDQLALRQPLNWFRLADLFEAEPTLEDEYSRLTLEERGWKVLRDQTLLALIHDVQALTRYVERKRRMVKAVLVQTENERKDTA